MWAGITVLLLATIFAGWRWWSEVQARQAEERLLEEAARSDRLVAEERLQGGRDADALAFLARASRYVPKSYPNPEKHSPVQSSRSLNRGNHFHVTKNYPKVTFHETAGKSQKFFGQALQKGSVTVIMQAPVKTRLTRLIFATLRKRRGVSSVTTGRLHSG